MKPILALVSVPWSRQLDIQFVIVRLISTLAWANKKESIEQSSAAKVLF